MSYREGETAPDEGTNERKSALPWIQTYSQDGTNMVDWAQNSKLLTYPLSNIPSRVFEYIFSVTQLPTLFFFTSAFYHDVLHCHMSMPVVPLPLFSVDLPVSIRACCTRACLRA